MLAKRVIGKSARVWRAAVGQATDPHGHEGVDVGDGQLLHFFVKLLNQASPIVQADLEHLAIFDLADPNQVEMGMGEEVLVGQFFDELDRRRWSASAQNGKMGLQRDKEKRPDGYTYIQVGAEETGQEKSQIGDKFLISSIASSVGLLQVQRQGNDV